jgi:hypothetical protein
MTIELLGVIINIMVIAARLPKKVMNIRRQLPKLVNIAAMTSIKSYRPCRQPNG